MHFSFIVYLLIRSTDQKLYAIRDLTSLSQHVDFQRNGYNVRLFFDESISSKLLFVILKGGPKLTIILLFPFKFCHLSVFPKPRVSVTLIGTMFTTESECSNCKEMTTRNSRLDLLGWFPTRNSLSSLQCRLPVFP